mmetsp:Transcript_13017/g.29565  ORF Transcript_13017/g.29565 Transcript_13017/m.29565 type:complete len:327 (-) Transcript_13017:247-1227(-)
MDMPNPADVLKEVSGELKEKFDDAGMDAVDKFVDKLDDIKDKAANGPKEVMEAVMEKFEEMKNKLKALLDDPSSLAPSAGALASCAAYYGNAVAQKLGDFAEEASKLGEAISKMAGEITEPMQKLADTITNAMKQLESSLKKLSKLPKEVEGLAETATDPSSFAETDTDSMKKCLDVSGIDAPLSNLDGLKSILGGAVDAFKACLRQIKEFIEAAPDKIKDAFGVPPPLCFLTGALMSQAPQAMTDMLEMVDKLKGIKLQPILDMLENVVETVGNLDISKVKTPVTKFASNAGASVDKLDKAVKAAKLSQNPAGAIGGKLGGMFGR